MDPAKAGQWSPNCFFRQNCNRKTHWYFVIAKSMCYFQLLWYIQKFTETPIVVSGQKTKFLHVSQEKIFSVWKCHVNSSRLILFFKFLVYFKPLLYLCCTVSSRNLWNLQGFFSPFIFLPQYISDVLLQRIPHCFYQTTAKSQDNNSPYHEVKEMCKYLNIGVYKTIVTRKRKTSGKIHIWIISLIPIEQSCIYNIVT